MDASEKLSRHWLKDHAIRAFFIMLASALVFGLTSYNLFFLIKANVILVVDYGIMALLDGALEELGKLFLYGVISLIAYILLKACEKVLVDKLTK